MKNNRKESLPDSLRPLFWSYNFSSLDPEKHKKTIIVNVINYGDLSHWRWIKKRYGSESIRKIIFSLPATEIKKRSGALAEILFRVKLNRVQRGAN